MIMLIVEVECVFVKLRNGLVGNNFIICCGIVFVFKLDKLFFKFFLCWSFVFFFVIWIDFKLKFVVVKILIVVVIVVVISKILIIKLLIFLILFVNFKWVNVVIIDINISGIIIIWRNLIYLFFIMLN